MSPRPGSPRPRLEATLLGLAVFGLYAWGACPTVYVGDSGELAAAAATLGIPHPSGYPLYVLLGKLWTLALPVGTVAHELSLLSAACAALAVALLHLVGRGLGLHGAAAASGALLLAAAPSFWGEANVQRVYALNAVFVVASLGIALRWHRTRRPRVLALALFVCGLGATNHTFMAVQAVAVAVFAVATHAEARRVRPLLAAGAAFGAGLVPYLFLPLRSLTNPRLDWGDPETPGRLLAVVLRREYWDRAWLAGPGDAGRILFDYLASLGSELLWLGGAAALAGVWLGRRRWPVGLPLLIMGGNLVAVALHGSRADLFLWHRYYIPSYAMAALLAALGIQRLVERLPARARAVPLLLPLAGLVLGFGANDRSRYRIADDFARKLLTALPAGAVLVASDDNVLFPLVYLKLVEGLRPDVHLVPQGLGQDPPPLRLDPDEEPLFFTHHPNWSRPELKLVPVGLVHRLVRAEAPPPHARLPEPLEGAEDPGVPKDTLTRSLIAHFHFMRGATLGAHDAARAMGALAAAAAVAPHDEVLHYNLGLLYERLGEPVRALAAFERSHAISPRPLPGSTACAAERIAALGRRRE